VGVKLGAAADPHPHLPSQGEGRTEIAARSVDHSDGRAHTMNFDMISDVKNTTAAQIAPVTPDDVVGMQDVFYRGWLATYPNAEHGITVDDIEDRYKDRYSEERLAKRREQASNPPGGETVLIARKNGKVVGVCRVMKHPDRNQLYAIYVLPEYHRQGIGTTMWKAAQEYLDPAKHTIVEVAIYNANAIKFYEGLGFVDTGKRMSDPKFTMKSGAIIPEMEMRREAIS
jgi:ribosomal protein S18 acetylase RimI-like enzyme